VPVQRSEIGLRELPWSVYLGLSQPGATAQSPQHTPLNTIYLVRRRSAKADIATAKVHDVLLRAATTW
jgi:hypothetical protein